MVVSAFMLGLGLGSLGGGWLSARSRVPLLLVFGMIELGIGAFGAVSLHLFHLVAKFTAGASAWGTGAITLVLLLVPTALMGSTLPILTAHLVRRSENVGRSVGALYFVNTLGSAVACFAAAVFLMRQLGESGSVGLAATLNAIVGLSALVLNFMRRSGGKETPRGVLASEPLDAPAAPTGKTLSYAIAAPVAGLAGFVSLGYEILWYRAFSFASQGRAQAFAILLGFYLAGIAFGSLLSRSLCRQTKKSLLGRQLRNISLFVIVANVLGYLVLPAMAFLARYWVGLGLPLISLAAAFLGATFPLISHVAVPPDSRAGRGLSWLYVSNIIGSTLGSLTVGYVLMDIWTIRQIAVAIALIGLALGAALLVGTARTGRSRLMRLGASCALAILVLVSAGPFFDGFYERLKDKRHFKPGYAFRDIVETRSGVAVVLPDLAVWGDGVYDGIINTDFAPDRNMVFRPLSISYWHPAPREVLVIGLSGGAWTQLIASHPQVEKLVAVEINPGYLRIIRKYPQVRSLLDNPKVSIEIDDGRRWLVRHPSAKFDVIVSNTTFNWRAHTTNLLSREFLDLIRRHLKPGGVFFYNLTGSEEAQLTGLTVFPYALMVGNCLAVSDSPFQLDIERWKRIISAYRIDGAAVFDSNDPAHRKKFEELVRTYTTAPQTDAIRAANRAKTIVTDDNMGAEWQGIAESVAKSFTY
jgi:spermidine synthase